MKIAATTKVAENIHIDNISNKNSFFTNYSSLSLETTFLDIINSPI
jgi:hypothetical protein